MPRRAAAGRRTIDPDPVHRSKLVQQVINRVMLDGKKSTAERIVDDALAILAERTGKEPVAGARGSRSRRLTPVLEVRSRRVGGATYQVPVEVPAPARPHPRRPAGWSSSPATAARSRWPSASPTSLLDAQSQQGGAYKRKDDIFRMAQANKAFAHYRW